MSAAPIETQPPATKPRRFQFTLRRLFIAVTLVALGFGWYMSPIEQEGRAVAKFRKAGGSVEYEGISYHPSRKFENPYFERYRSRHCNIYQCDGFRMMDVNSCLQLARHVSANCSLYIHHHVVTDSNLSLLNELSNLRGLYVSLESEADIRELSDLNQLQVLHLTEPPLSADGLAYLAKQFPSLETLGFNSADGTGYEEITRLQTLRRLDFTDIHRPANIERLSFLATLPALNELHFRRAITSDHELAYISGCRDLQRLKISLAQHGTSIAGLVLLQNLEKLRHLDIEGADGFLVPSVQPIFEIASLESITLKNISLSKEDLEMLAKGERFHSLSWENVQCDRHGLKHLSHMKNLRKMRMMNCGLTVDDLMAMERFPGTELFELQEDRNAIDPTNQCIRDLAVRSTATKKAVIISASNIQIYKEGRCVTNRPE